MGRPVAVGHLVADQRVAGGVVGDAQQRLGEAHQRHAFLARERIFVDQPLDAAALVVRAQRRHQRRRRRIHRGDSRRIERGGIKQRRKAQALVTAVGGGDRLTQK